MMEGRWPFLHDAAQGPVGADEVILTQELVEVPGSHPGCERGTFLRLVEER